MKIILPMTAFAVAMLTVSAPGVAQMNSGTGTHATGGDMKSHDMSGHDMKGKDMKGHGAMMSEADKTKMASCHAMSHDMAMKDAGCAALMKAHPQGMDHSSKKSM